MVVTVEKPEGPILEFDCNFNDDELAIENMRMLNRDNLDAENVYAGLPFLILDDSFQKASHRYLEVRGIKHSLHDWLYEYTMRKDEKEYVVWLKNMREFIGGLNGTAVKFVLVERIGTVFFVKHIDQNCANISGTANLIW